MPSPRRSKWFIATVVTAFVAAVTGFAIWRAFSPKIHTASLAEIKRVIPTELLVEKPEDLEAQSRYKMLSALVKSLDKDDISKLLNSTIAVSGPSGLPPGSPTSKPATASPKEQLDLAERIWSPKPDLLAQIDEILSSGPLQQQRPKGSTLVSFPELSEMKSFVKTATTSAELFARAGESEHAVKLLSLAVKLCNRLFDSDGELIDYLTAVADDAIVSRSIQHIASKSRFPVKDCVRLLSIIPPARSPDEAAISAFRSDFQRSSLPFFASDPRKTMYQSAFSPDDNPDQPNSRPFVGTYEALETAQQYGRFVSLALTNLVRPLSGYDDTADKLLDRVGAALPKVPDPEKPGPLGKWWDEMAYRFAMNNSSNTIGRTFIANGFGARNVLVASCRIRAWRDMVRLLLASRLYRSTHRGRLPSKPTDLIPPGWTWPQDPFNGKPMMYLPKREIVYCVGADLVDDGGDISTNPSRGRDFGISLKLDTSEVSTRASAPSFSGGD